MKFFRTAMMVVALSAPVLARGQGGNPPPKPKNRAELEQRVRERMSTMVKTRLGLTDDQVRKLGETNTRFEERRRLLHDQERDIRMGMRDELLLGDKANQNKVGELLDRLLKVQRQRLDIMEQEQKELATFLTPVQRVRFHALQDQMRKWREESRRGGGGGRGGGGPPGPRPGRPGRDRPMDAPSPF